MKNLKNMAAALSLMAVMGLGAVSANAGLIISDRSAECAAPTSGGIIRDIQGIMTVSGSMLEGIIIIGRDGIIISDKSNGCSTAAKDGIIISD